MSASGSVWRELLPFFNGDERGRLFANVFFNSTEPVNFTKESLAKDLITRANYTDTSGAETDTSGAEMEEFVEQLGKFHRAYNTNLSQYPELKKLLALSRYNILTKFKKGTHDIDTDTVAKFLPDPTDHKSIDLRTKYLDGVKSGSFNRTKDLQQKTGFTTLYSERIVHKRLVGLKKKSENYPVYHPVEDVISVADKNIWKYEGDRLYRVEPGTNKKIFFGDNDELTRASFNNIDNCRGTFVTNKQTDCDKHVYECLFDEENPDSLKNCWIATGDNGITNDFYNKAKKDISSMHPLVALRTLQRFGFRTSLKYDTDAHMDLNKVESVDHWKHNYLNKKFPNEADTVKNNENLLKYLDLVVQYVNANPALLNKHFNGNTLESAGKSLQSSYAKALNLQENVPKSGAINEMFRFNGYLANRMPPTILRSPYGGSTVALSAVPRGFNSLGGLPMAFGQQYGGANVPQLQGAALVQNVIAIALNTMKHFNKSLDSESHKRLMDKINNMQKVERELNHTIEYLSEYSTLLELFGDYTGTTLNERTVEELVSRYNRLMQKHSTEEQSMMTVLTALHKLSAGQETDAFSEVGTYSEIRGRV